jgi:hypothetical protein
MTNKLKLTSALVAGSLVGLVATSANAQTYYKDGISGNLALSYIAQKSENKVNSYRGFGKESQFNLAASGALNNGWNYKAGTSIEMDGNDGITTAATGTTSNAGSDASALTVAHFQGQQAENTFIDFINGNTTISIGADHMNFTDTNITNIVGFGYIAADGVNNAKGLYPQNVSAYSAFGFGAVQNTGLGKFAINYLPSATKAASANDIFNVVNSKAVGQAESAYEINYSGNLGLNGLTVIAGYTNSQRLAVGNSADATSTRIGAKYNFGSFTVAADRSRETNMQDMSGFTSTQGAMKLSGDSVGVAYAINKELSVGATYAEAKNDNKVTYPKIESTTILAVGYNLGPVSVQGQYKNAQNVSGIAANDGQSLSFYVNTNF